MKALVLTSLLFSLTSVNALEITSCKRLEDASYVLSPVQKNIKTYYSGKLEVVNISTNGEPACCSAHVLFYIKNKKNKEKCFALTNYTEDDGYQSGFFNFDFKAIKSSYDPNKGLLLSLPYKKYEGTKGMAKVRVNMATKTLKIEK